MRRAVALILLVLTAGATALAEQSPNDLVVVINGATQFHKATCPLVAKAGSHVKVMKRSEAMRKGLTAHDCGSLPGAYLDPNTVKVYTQPNDNKYHLTSCQKLGATRTEITLEEAGKKYWPCPVCHPPIRQRTPQS